MSIVGPRRVRAADISAVAIGLYLTKSDVLPKHRVDKFIGPLSLWNPFENGAEFLIYQSRDELIDELNVHFLGDLPRSFQDNSTDFVRKHGLVGFLLGEEMEKQLSVSRIPNCALIRGFECRERTSIFQVIDDFIKYVFIN